MTARVSPQVPAALANFGAEVGIVLGSGLGAVVSAIEIEREVSFADMEGFPEVTVSGHSGKLSAGTFAGKRILVAQGRVHLYEGHDAADVTACVRAMSAAGVRCLILTNAAGALTNKMEIGEWMSITDHLNLTGKSPLTGKAKFVDMTGLYDDALRRVFSTAAEAESVPLFSGVYAGVQGPQYETPAEVRMLVRLGADAVGMSTVLEAIQARALGMRVSGFSCLTNWAAGISGDTLDHNDVLNVGTRAAEKLMRILSRGVRLL